jgi:hypothetical protein
MTVASTLSIHQQYVFISGTRNVFFLLIIRLSFVYLSLGSPCKNRPAANRVAVARSSCAQYNLPGVPRPGPRRRCVPLRGRCHSVPLRRQGSLGESRPRDMTFEMSAIHSCRLLHAGIHRVMGEGASGNGPSISREDIIRAGPR